MLKWLVFLQYLWGIETEGKKALYDYLNEFLQYLWGIETLSYYLFQYGLLWVFTVPMRNWNRSFWKSLRVDFQVFTVPMRNWNLLCNLVFLSLLHVFTVPMRNWNSSCSLIYVQFSCTFLQYLWGIETFFFLNLLQFLLLVFTVPMRNWNQSIMLRMRFH